MITSHDIRKMFLTFFATRNHRIVASSSLVPANDPTLLFANAGMNQFKDVFLGRERRDYLRAVTSQKCVRAGGKHNDLEQVGRTTRHHTFFEMLGNFSFGDYFKKEAIPWAWELITRDFAIPRERLYVTTFLGSGSGPEEYGLLVPCDDEAYDIWVAQGVPHDRIFRLGLKENFWQMGDTGPCGPCSEIHYDLDPLASEQGHTDCKFPCDCGRYVELWNLVFMQYSRYCRYERDGYPPKWDEKAKAEHKHSDNGYECLALDLLPKPSIDTGAGLERLASVLQGKLSNFETDLFRPLIEEAASLANLEYGANHDADVSLRIIADHARASTFLISDGVLPSNEGRGYVLRLIMRRALYHGQTLGLNEPFLYKISSRVVDMMKDAYPELVQVAPHVAKAVKLEEERYAQTTRVGLDRLEQVSIVTNEGIEIPFYKYKEHAHEFGGEFPTPSQSPIIYHTLYRRSGRSLPPAGVRWVPGDELFKLHDTFGLRPDFVEDVVKNYGLTIDREGYEAEMRQQRERARASWKGAEKKTASPVFLNLAEEGKTEFDGYTQATSVECRIMAVVQNGELVSEAKRGEEAEVVLDHTPFYAEAGGQVGDTGHFSDPATEHEIAHVLNTYRPVSGLIVHKVVVREHVRLGESVTAVVDAERRDAIRRNHTATHLLHAALRRTLGTHVKQAGSLVAPDRLRFDFTHYAGLGDQDLLDIEDLVNEHILKNEEVVTTVMDLDAAVNTGAMALFGEKYADQVRVLTIDDFSKELCGGTHVRRTGDIGLFKVVSEGSVAAGTRRIEAVTGKGLLDHLRLVALAVQQQQERLLKEQPGRISPYERAKAILGGTDPVTRRFQELEKKVKKLEAQQMKHAVDQARQLIGGIEKAPADSAAGFWKDETRQSVGVDLVVKGVRVIAARVEVTDRSAMRQMVDDLRAKLQSGVIVLGSVADGKVSLIAAVTKDLTAKVDAGKIVKQAAVYVEGSGGGRKDLAEAGGKNPAKLDEAIQAVPGIIEQML